MSRKVLRVLIWLNLLVGVLILGLLVTSVVVGDSVMRALAAGTPPANATLFLGMRLVAVIVLSAVPVVHFILTRILAIVDTVSVGDPFVMPNAAGLQKIAWALLILELMHLAVGAIAAAVRFSTLEAICDALECQPGDLLTFASTAEEQEVA